jgi:hypothetical protein
VNRGAEEGKKNEDEEEVQVMVVEKEVDEVEG